MNTFRSLLRYIALLTVCLLLFPVCVGASDGFVRPGTPTIIAVASDLHVDSSSWDTGLVNPLVPYNAPLADALFWDAAQQKADVLLLCGDITNQGKQAQHRLLLEKLEAARDSGLPIYVVPGNHDIGEVTPEQFALLYDHFGFGDAYSRDENSLSYSVLLGDLMLLMLDTKGYEGSRNAAFLTEKTQVWMQRQLAAAQNNGWRVIVVGHYPLLTAHSTEFHGKEETIALFTQYGVPLYLCGHLHGRSVSARSPLTELVVDQSISSPCYYATLFLEEDGAIRYEPRKIDVIPWASATGSEDSNLLDFDKFQLKLARQRNHEIIMSIQGKKEFPEDKLKLAEDFFWKMSDYSSQGVLHWHADELLGHPGYEALMELSAGSVYSRWVPSVLANTVPYTAGFTIRSGEITATVQ